MYFEFIIDFQCHEFFWELYHIICSTSIQSFQIVLWILSRYGLEERKREIKRLRDEETKPYLIIDLGH